MTLSSTLLFKVGLNMECKYSFVFGIFLRMGLVAQNWSLEGELAEANLKTMSSNIVCSVD